MKRRLLLPLILGLAGMASAEDLARWDFTGVDNSSISNAADSVNGYTFPDHYGTCLSNNTLWVTAGTNGMWAGPTFDAPVSTRIRATWTVPMANLSADSTLGIAFKDAAGTALGSLRLGAGSNGKLRLSSYTRKPDDSGMQWVYVAWLGGVSTLSGPINLTLEYDPATGTNYLSWSGSYNGTKDVAALPGDVASMTLEIQNGSLTNTDYMNMDDLFVKSIGAPTGLYIKKIETAFISGTNATIRIGSFGVTNGDYLAVMLASSAGQDPVESSVTFGGDAVVGTVQYMTANSGAGAPAFAWYVPATSNGTVDVDCTMADTNATFIVGAYQLRSATGGIDLLTTAQDAGQGLAGIANIYAFSSVSTGLFLEAVSAYANATPDNTATVVDENHWSQRIVAHGEFEGASEMTNGWSFASTTTAGTVGLAFGPRASGAPSNQQQYDTWAASNALTGADADMTADPDADGFDNLVEYAFGGDPSDVNDAGNVPSDRLVEDAGVDYLQYVHYERDDAATRGLTYVPEVNDDLTTTNWTASGIQFVGSGPSSVAGFLAVTNRIPATQSEQFLHLKIELAP